MKVVICGATQVGYEVASYLSKKDYDVILVEEKADLLAHVSETLDVQTVHGCGAHPSVLESLDLNGTSLFVAAMPQDEFNIIACQIAERHHIPKKIACLHHQAYTQSAWIQNSTFIDCTISPPEQVAEMILSTLRVSPRASEVIPLTSPPQAEKIYVIGAQLKEKCPLSGTVVPEIEAQLGSKGLFKVLAITRQDTLIIPRGKEVLQAQDLLYFLTDQKSLTRNLAGLNIFTDPIQSIVIGGGGHTGFALSQKIHQTLPDVDLKILEADSQRAQFLAQSLSTAIILNGSATDPSVLKEANAHQADIFISITNDDSANIFSTLLAKSLGCSHAITLLQKPVYPKLLYSLGVHTILSTSFSVLSRVLSFMRTDLAFSTHIFQSGLGEIFEIKVGPTSELAGLPFDALRKYQGTQISGAFREGNFFIPSATDLIEESDFILMTATTETVEKLANLLKELSNK